jgi:hypothetical protein
MLADQNKLAIPLELEWVVISHFDPHTSCHALNSDGLT